MLKSLKERRQGRHERVRRKVSGTAERPRMAIMISNKHMYVQFVNDECAATLAAASTMKGEGKKNVEAARELGRRCAEVAQEKGIRQVVVDRGGRRFHGRVKAIVDAVTESGVSIRSAKEEK